MSVADDWYSHYHDPLTEPPKPGQAITVMFEGEPRSAKVIELPAKVEPPEGSFCFELMDRQQNSDCGWWMASFNDQGILWMKGWNQAEPLKALRAAYALSDHSQ